MRGSYKIWTLTAAAGFLFVAAGAAQAAGGKTQPVSISFALRAGGKEVGCGAPLADLGTGRLPAKLDQARLYVYGFALIDGKGRRTPVALAQNDWQYA
ncbi:MAG TPA: metallo-mystery pair system four-Cys motif protein, partial [Methylosinus sp.]